MVTETAYPAERGLENTVYEPYQRYKLTICFDGSNYGGWQIQPNSLAVQEVIQKVLSRIYNKLPIFLIGSSRTDAGVHAIGFVASFLTPQRPYLSPEQLKDALNRLLPRDIRIPKIEVVDLRFHARYDALGKAYTYCINCGDETPFSNRYSFHPRRNLNQDLMREGAQYLLGKHDFSSFVCCRNAIDDAVRTIYKIELQNFDRYLCVTYIGDGFLYKMIRCLTGGLLAVGDNSITQEQLKAILQQCDRTKAPTTASPQGLFLDRVFYSTGELENFHLTQIPFFF